MKTRPDMSEKSLTAGTLRINTNITLVLLFNLTLILLGSVAQSVTCLTADPGVASLILAQSHSFVEIGHEIISAAILLPSADSRRIVVSYK